VCLVYVQAHYWLRQSAHRAQAHLAGELGVNPATSPGVANPDVTGVLPKVADDPTTLATADLGRSAPTWADAAGRTSGRLR
jgi:hypothetical protein